MPSREQIAAALKYMGDKANLRQRFKRATSLDPQEQDMADIAVETAASFVPGVGQALAARDVERARRANDPAGMAMASMGAIPGGRLAKLLKRYDPVMQQLDVYHGTPHKFPATEANPLGEFDASKIGTGEGAQAYGHGIYLAEAENVGRDYAQSLSQRLPNRVQLDNTPIKGDTIFSRAIEKLGTQGKEAALKDLDDSIRRNETYAPDMAELYRDVRRQILEIDPKKVNVNQGTLYKADLPDEMIDRMLDWDKPLSEQRELATPILKELGYLRPNDDGPRQFSQAVKALALEHGGFGESGATGMALFNAIYKGLQQGKPKAINLAKRMNLNEQEMFMEASPLASEVMKRMGIPGIKYLDAGSRGQGGSGTRNFVVFPGEEKKVRILERDGQKAPPQKIAQALEAAPSKAAKAEPQPFGVQGYLNDDLRRVKQNFFSQYGVEENKQFSKDYEVVELAKLKPSENINESKIQSLMKTMREEGNARDNPIPPIIVDSEGNILDGHHRYEAAKRLGAKYVPIVELFDKRKGPVFSE